MERLEDTEPHELEELNADISRFISARLSVSARKLRLSTSSRSHLYSAAGLRPRRADRLFSLLRNLLTVLLLVTPIAVSVVYFGFLASPQFQSQTQFTVRSSTPALGKDQLGEVTGIPSAKIFQDTQVVVNFIESNEIIKEIKQRLDLEKIYSRDQADWWARLPKEASEEDVLKYWNRMVTVSVSPTSGIVTVEARAFTASDANKVVQEILRLSEVTVNRLNDRIWRDVIGTAQANFDVAAKDLQAAREAVAKQQNASGVLSVEGSSEVISNLLSAVQGDLLRLQQRYEGQVKLISESAPQMVVLKNQILAKQRQVDQLKQQLAGANSQQKNLADISEQLSQLQLAQTLAEQKFAASLKSFEQVKFVSKQQLVYLDSFLAPTVPDEAEYPKRTFWIGGIIASSLCAWALAMGLLHASRSRWTN